MPVATSFTALGTGNGFPYCLIKSDISSFDHWVTLGGYKKTDAGGVTQEQIHNSFVTAMNLYWNTYALHLDVGMSGADSGSVKSYSNNILEVGANNLLPAEPFQRVCEDDIEGGSFIGGGISGDPSVDPDANQAGFFTVRSGGFTINIHRYYNGDRNNEDNFIGYGLGAEFIKFHLRGVSDLPGGGGGGFIRASAVYSLDSITPSITTIIPDDAAVGYTTISGVPFVYASFASTAPVGPDDPASEVSFGENGASGNCVALKASAKVENPSIEFYTYS